LSSRLITDLLLVSTVTGIALAAASAGVWLVSARRAGGPLVAFGAGLLMGMAVFGVLPEAAEQAGLVQAAVILALGVGLLWAVDRYVHPVCPSCSHTHDHDRCAVSLHGFAAPLVVAASLHSLMDGLAVAASRRDGSDGLVWGVFLAVAIHKIPEGLAYGTILRAALQSRKAALWWCFVTQAPTIAGGAIESVFAANFGEGWLVYPLALAGGSFLFLGWHAIHNEFKRRGAVPALGPALTGALGAAILQQGLRAFLH